MSTVFRRRTRNNHQAVIIVDDDGDNAEGAQTDTASIFIDEDDVVVPTQPIGAAAEESYAAAAATHAAKGAQSNQQSAMSPQQQPAAAAADSDAGSSCTICLELLFEQGSHRPAALNCGHIFGSDCIRDWLRVKQRCPQCNQKAKARDIRLLYNLPKAVVAWAGDADLEAKLKESEESRKRERERAARLEAQLQEVQRQLALRQHPQIALQVNDNAAAAATALHSNGRHWQDQALHHQQHMYPQHGTSMTCSGPGAAYQRQPGLGSFPRHATVGQKRSWEAASSEGGVQAPLPPLPALHHHQQQQPPPAAGPADDSIAAAAPAAAGGTADGPQLVLLPFQRRGAAAVVPDGGVHVQQRQVAGGFMEMQQYKLENSRCFHLDVPGALLLVGERPNAHSSRLRKISLLCPASPSYLTLPSATGVVRGLAAQQDAGLGSSYGSNLLAVATERAGLQLVSIGTNNVVQTVPVQSPIWSVAWSPQYEHQVLMGLDKGRVAVADLRKPSDDMLLSLSSSTISSSSSSGRIWQPLHSLIALQDWQLDQLMEVQPEGENSSKWSGLKPEAIVACTGGLYSWTRHQPDTFNLLLASSCHGGTCESIALAPDGSTVAASFRAPMNQTAAASAGASRGAPVHLLAKLGVLQAAQHAAGNARSPAAATSAAAATAATQDTVVALPSQAAVPVQPTADASIAAGLHSGRNQLLQATLLLSGHSSRSVMTRGCFLSQLPGVQDEQMLFVSADESSCEARLWGCSSGRGLLPTRPWVAMQSPVLQVSGGVSNRWGTLVCAMSERGMSLCEWVQDAYM